MSLKFAATSERLFSACVCITGRLVIAAWVCVAASAAVAQTDTETSAEHPLRPAIRYAEQCRKRIAALPGYSAEFHKREIVNGTEVVQKMRIKIRHEPFSVYLYFAAPHEGREVIYVEGRNNGNLLAHETGIASLIGTLELAPNSSRAMSENRYPITMAGISKAVEGVLAQWEEETKYGESEVKYFRDAKLAGMKCRVIQCTHPQPRRQFKFHKTLLWIDDATGFPVRIQQYGFPARAGGKPPLIEDYTYTDIKADIQLTDRDFDPQNPRYNF